MTEEQRKKVENVRLNALSVKIRGSYPLYESYKAQIRDIGLEPTDYERAIRSIAQALRV